MVGFEWGIVIYGLTLSSVFAAVCYWGLSNNYGKAWQWNTLGLVASAVIFMGFEGMASQPKPFYLEMYKADSYTLHYYISIPHDRIYVYMTPYGQQTPRSYTIPWTIETEEEIADGVKMAKERGIPPHFWYDKDYLAPAPLPPAVQLQKKNEG